MPNISHFGAMLFFAAAASATLAFHSRPPNRSALLYAVKTFLTFVGGAILIGWLLFPISR